MGAASDPLTISCTIEIQRGQDATENRAAGDEARSAERRGRETMWTAADRLRSDPPRVFQTRT